MEGRLKRVHRESTASPPSPLRDSRAGFSWPKHGHSMSYHIGQDTTCAKPLLTSCLRDGTKLSAQGCRCRISWRGNGCGTAHLGFQCVDLFPRRAPLLSLLDRGNVVLSGVGVSCPPSFVPSAKKSCPIGFDLDVKLMSNWTYN